MDKIIDVPALNHIIKLTDRKNIIISGIKKNKQLRWKRIWLR